MCSTVQGANVGTNGAFLPTLEYGGILHLQDAIAGKIAAVLGVLRKSPTPSVFWFFLSDPSLIPPSQP